MSCSSCPSSKTFILCLWDHLLPIFIYKNFLWPLQSASLLKYVLYKEICFFRFLSWAIHVFAYDLAFEPEGWPWRPVRYIQFRSILTLIIQIGFVVQHIQELVFSQISDSEPTSVACLHSFLLQHLFFAIIFSNVIILIFHFAALYYLKH